MTDQPAVAATGQAQTLAPCPFCDFDEGELSPFFADTTGREMHDRAYVSCNSCGAVGPRGDTDAEAIAAWNTAALRSRPTLDDEVIERLARGMHDHFACCDNINECIEWETAADKIRAALQGGGE